MKNQIHPYEGEFITNAADWLGRFYRSAKVDGPLRRFPSFVITGPSRVGKSTLATRLAAELGCPLIRLDDARYLWYTIEEPEARLKAKRTFYEMLLQKYGRGYVIEGTDVLFYNLGWVRDDGNNVKERNISYLLELREKYQIRPVLVGCPSEAIVDKVRAIKAYQVESNGKCPLFGKDDSSLERHVKRIIRWSEELLSAATTHGVFFVSTTSNGFDRDIQACVKYLASFSERLSEGAVIKSDPLKTTPGSDAAEQLRQQVLDKSRTMHVVIDIDDLLKRALEGNSDLLNELTDSDNLSMGAHEGVGAARASMNRRILREKPLSAFPRVGTVQELLSGTDDSILIVGHDCPEDELYLNDLPAASYLLALNNALLVPGRLKKESLPPEKSVGMPKGIFYRTGERLLVTGDGELIADSFVRSRTVSSDIMWHGDGCWSYPPLEVNTVIDEPCVFVDLVSGQFGHALVDTPARLWPLTTIHQKELTDLLFVGVGTHKVNSDPGSWPRWLNELMSCYGLPLSRLKILEGPTRCRKLIVPKSISPYWMAGGRRYNQLMSRTGDRLTRNTFYAKSEGKKVFLSRSRLNEGKRGLGEVVEMELDQLFQRLGFTIVHAQELSLGEQVSIVRNASHIAGCVGSQMHLLAFCNQTQFKALRIAPKFFAWPTDANIVAGIPGGGLEDFIVDCEPVPGEKRDKSPWTLTLDDMARLHEFVVNWVSC